MKIFNKKVVASVMAVGLAIAPLQGYATVFAQESGHYYDFSSNLMQNFSNDVNIEFITLEEDGDLERFLETLDIQPVPTMEAEFLPTPRSIINEGPRHPTGLPDINLTPEQMEMAIEMGLIPQQHSGNLRSAPANAQYNSYVGTISTPGYE